MDLPTELRRQLEATPGAGCLCVAWSGGLDSTVLLDLVDRVAPGLGLEVCAVHVDHRLHEESAEAAAFCRQWAHRRGIALRLEEVEVAGGASVEQQARLQRYAAVGQAAEAMGADLVLTAHQADDAVETALLHLTRGTGLRGLTSLAPGRERSFTVSPVAVTLRLDLVDAASGTLLGRVVEHHRTHDTTRRLPATRTANLVEAERILTVWSSTLARHLTSGDR